jgi:hypothetical protein
MENNIKLSKGTIIPLMQNDSNIAVYEYRIKHTPYFGKKKTISCKRFRKPNIIPMISNGQVPLVLTATVFLGH